MVDGLFDLGSDGDKVEKLFMLLMNAYLFFDLGGLGHDVSFLLSELVYIQGQFFNALLDDSHLVFSLV